MVADQSARYYDGTVVTTEATDLTEFADYVANLTPEPDGVPVSISDDDIERGVAAYLLPNGPSTWKLETVDLTRERERRQNSAAGPRRIVSTVQLDDVESLNTYLGRHGDATTTVYADVTNLCVTAIVDAHEPGKPAWQQHRAVLSFKRTPLSNIWAQLHGQLVPQAKFVEVIEDGLPAVTKPDGGELFDMLQGFRVTSKAEFDARVNVSSGKVTFSYSDESTAKVGKGNVEAPQRLSLALPLFLGGEVVSMTARLKWSIGNDGLLLGVTIDRFAESTHEAFRAEVSKITTGLVVYGRPA